MTAKTKNFGKLYEKFFRCAPRYEIIEERTISVDKTGKGHYVELMGLDYSDCWGSGMIQILSEKNPDYYYQSRWRECLRKKGERNYRIVSDFIESIYHEGERIK